ncbi:MerC domain-containing protein [Verrucomicrobiales bacterium]|jgi:hypothetical protein|nr:MerC domain-containing protein [Verrucomicrobiales bacterium]
MITTASTPILKTTRGAGADRIGVVASVLCAIHCAATPLLLLFAPAFGEFWSHPASHWIVALFVVPLALVMVLRGFRIHRKRWIVATGLLGMALVIAGAAVPYWPDANESVAGNFEAAATNDGATGTTTEGEDFVWNVGEEMPGEATAAETEGCLDSCCPSLVTDSEGNTKLHIPTASVVTTLGGVALICTHLGNLCACRKRRKSDCCDSPLC